MVGVRTIRTAIALTGIFGATACDSTPTPGIARGEAVFDTCVPCHGTDGSGNAVLGAPAIAGQPQWYITAQLEKFQNGQRGANPFDTVGLRMKSMSLALDVAGDLESVAEYVASMDPVDAPASFAGGNIEAGGQSYAVCAACHGEKAGGNEALGAPPLQGQYDWYVLKQLQKFRSGWRGTAAGDGGGAMMRPNAMAMDRAAMENIIAYIGTLE